MMAIQNQAQKVQTARVYDLERYRGIKAYMAANIRSFIRHGDSLRRQAMHTLCSAILSNHNRTRMDFPTFTIYRGDGCVIFHPKIHIADFTCPGCGRQLTYDNMTFVQVQEERPYEDLVVWGCRKCGEVFTRVEYTGGGFSDA